MKEKNAKEKDTENREKATYAEILRKKQKPFQKTELNNQFRTQY